MPGTHATLAASASYRWLHCPASVALTAHLPEQESAYAAEGTLAHSICELVARWAFVEPMPTRTYNARMNKLRKDPLYSAEMEHCADVYREEIEQLILQRVFAPHVALEQRVDFADYVPDGFGTSDCIIIGGGILDVVDYKHGKGISVDATANSQLMLYALGAYKKYGAFYPVSTVRLHVVQPRLGNISHWTISIGDLTDWGTSIKPIAKAAYEGSDECCPGDWCDKGFCGIRATCRARADYFIQSDFAKHYDKQGSELTPDELGKILTEAQNLASWVKQLEAYALEQLLQGGTVSGWKVVEGRSNRAISDCTAAFAKLTAVGFDEALLYERKPLGITALEKLVGKQLGSLIGDYIIKPKGKPTLVPESDKRPIYSTATDDFAGAAE